MQMSCGKNRPNKDVDGLTPANIGRLWMEDTFEPATAEELLPFKTL